jgi:O-antigen ligase
MSKRVEIKLLLAARILLLMLPLWLISGRAAVDADLSLIAIMFLVRSAVMRDWSWARSTWFRIGLGLWLWTLVVSVFAFDHRLSFSQAAPWIRFLLFAAALESWVLDEVWMHRLLWVATGTLVFVAFDTLLQYFHGSDVLGNPRWGTERLTSVFERPRVGIFITKLMFPAVFGAFAWHAWRRGRLWPSMAFAGLVLLLLTAIFLSGERMALLLALLGLTLGALLQKGMLRVLVAGALSLGIVTSVILALANPELIKRQVDETLHTLNHLSESPYGKIWSSGLQMAMERPLFGAGMKNFRVVCPKLDMPQSVEERCSTHPHNTYLEWASESGIPGLLGFLLLVGALFRRLWQVVALRGYGVWLMGPLVSMVVYLWPLGPTGSFFSNWAGGMFWLAVGWALAAARLLERSALTEPALAQRGGSS